MKKVISHIRIAVLLGALLSLSSCAEVAGIIVEDTCGGQERHHLEQAGTQRFLNAIVTTSHENKHNGYRSDENHHRIGTKLAVAQNLLKTAFEERQIQQRETCAAEEHEEDSRVVDVEVVEIASAGIVCGNAACGRDRHGIVYAVKAAHTFQIEAEGTGNSQEQVDTP